MGRHSDAGNEAAESSHSSPLLTSHLAEGASPRVRASPSPRSLLPTFPRNVSICQLAGGASDEESAAHKRIQRKLIAALILAFIFMIVEVVGGIFAHSLAIITDAAHLLSDVSGFAVAVLAAYWAKRRSHEHFSYGYHRVEVLGALASVMTVWLVTGVLLFEAVQRIITPEPVNGKLMFIIAVTGVVVNLLMLAILGHHHHGHGGGCSGHSHGHSNDHAHEHEHGGACGGHAHAHKHGGEGGGGAKRQLALNGAAAGEAAGGGCNGHHHSHSEGEGSDLEAAEQGHAHAHPHAHAHSHGDDEHAHGACAGHSLSHRHAHVHSEDEGEEHHCSGHTPILKPGGTRSCADGEHTHAHGSSGVLAAPAPAANGGGGGGGHSHDHANMNVRGAIIHVIGDFVQSIGVCIAGALIWWHQDDPRWFIADPICTFLFAVLVLWTTRAILRDISDVLMERVPRGLCIKTINDDMSRVPGVEEVHDLHVWSLTPGIPLLCAHITLSQEADATAVLHALTAHCRGIGIDHSTIQLILNGSACPCDA
ncbi:zinc transporter 8 isoform X1 [Micractinium conductrix]|uniref:Zinc transporter 8 isoform X1 n=1 Tax=Micractinium conductrix TaxID=554055 RepID=A0A2P6V2G1_9CHLO|nr:zinc transporter 8 isoform X1 [Micractinium conductrix]|eukprot:PSC68288.1 zinc transporter 8 isoform X1 [Micractinium conductrix]